MYLHLSAAQAGRRGALRAPVARRLSAARPGALPRVLLTQAAGGPPPLQAGARSSWTNAVAQTAVRRVLDNFTNAELLRGATGKAPGAASGTPTDAESWKMIIVSRV